jgi:peptide/nickel transport system substrate-binding protein
MLTELDQAKRDQLIAEAWKLLNADMIYLPIHHQVIVWAMSGKLDLPIVANDSPQFRWAKFRSS